MKIREYNEATDKDDVYRCIESIQDFERQFIPTMPKGADIQVEYLEETLAECKKYAGKVLVAAHGASVVGYVCIYTKMVHDKIEDGNEEFAYIADLIVLEEHRGSGLGKKLIAAAENHARDAGARRITIGVLTQNIVAADLYVALEYKPFAMQLEKTL